MSYLGSLVVYCDLVVLVRVFAGEKLLERFFDIDLETARLQGDFIVTDASASNGTFGNWGIACGIVYVSGVGPGSGMLPRVTLAIVYVRCSVRVENSRSSAGLGRLRAHATGELGRRHQSMGAGLGVVGGEDGAMA
jgi:hypothetical protein